MSKPQDDWQSYIEAAQRKISIAAYHEECLQRELTSISRNQSSLPPIPIQAHCEGVIVSVIAAVDQVAKATKSALRLRLGEQDLVTGAFGSLAQTMPGVKSWFNEPIGHDLRRIRVRMIHHTYVKTRQGYRWSIGSADTNFEGPRELLAYTESAVRYGERLRDLLPLIEDQIAKRTGEGTTSN